jgi:hypothetical protein
MAGPIFKVFLTRLTPAWFELSEDAQGELLAKLEAAMAQVGGKQHMMCWSAWCNEQWHYFGVEEYPDLDAVQRHAQLLAELGWSRYSDAITALGTSV